MKIGIFIEVSNLYHTLKQKYDRKLDYRAYYKYIHDLGDIHCAYAYGAQEKDEAEKFMSALRHIGFTPRFKRPKTFYNPFRKKADWDVDIALDIMEAAMYLDTIVLGTADGDLEPVVRRLKNNNKKIIVLACGISSDLVEIVDMPIEIPESLLETSNETIENAQRWKLHSVCDSNALEDDTERSDRGDRT